MGVGGCVCLSLCGRSVLRDGAQATRWRSDSAVSPRRPSPTDLSTCGPPEGHNILLSDHNTQTNAFYDFTLSASFQQETHNAPVCPERFIWSWSFLVVLHAPLSLLLLAFPCFSAFPPPLNGFFPPHRTNRDKHAAGKHPEWYYAQ